MSRRETDKAYRTKNRVLLSAKAKERWRKKRNAEGPFWNARNLKARLRSPAKYILFNAKKNAKEKSLEFNLTEEDIVIPELCPVLGIPLQINVGGSRNNSPSIDRFDSSKGYVKGNINIISWRANDLKSNGTLEEFKGLVRWLERVG